MGPARRHRHRSRRATIILALLLAALIATSCADTENAAAQAERGTDANATSRTGQLPSATSSDEPGSGSVGTNDGPTPAIDIDAAAEPTLSEPTLPPATLPEPSPTAVTRPAAPNGRVAPAVASSPQELADQLAVAEIGLSSATATAAQLADWGHLHQVAIRKLGYEPAWDVDVFESLPTEFRARTLLHVSARRALIDLSSGYDAADFIPAWQIIDPEPASALLSHYKEAEAATGVEWEYLAAINLVETGMGRIRGLSSAGAQGPMQFLPTTWNESGIGAGDIDDPRDAINGAARYLVRRGGPADMPGAIWGYNNSDDYVTAVSAYAELLRQDPSAYAAIYNWEIYFFTEAGDVWLPSGFMTEATLDLSDFLEGNPWSAPDPGLR